MCGKAGNTSGDRDAEKEVGSSRAGKASVVTSGKPATIRDLLGSDKFTEAVLASLKDAKAGAIKEKIPKRIRMDLGFSFLPFFSLPFFSLFPFPFLLGSVLYCIFRHYCVCNTRRAP